MIYNITYCDEHERVIQAVLVDGRVSELNDGRTYRAEIDKYIERFDTSSLTYKIETEQGILVGFFVYEIIADSFSISLRRPFENKFSDIYKEVSDFVATNVWVFDTLDGTNIDEIKYSFTEYNADDYRVQQYDFIWMDEVERVAQAVIIASDSYTRLSDGRTVRTDADSVFKTISEYDIAYKIENKQGVLVGFFAYDIEDDKKIVFTRKPFKQYNEELNIRINDFIASGRWRFDYLNVGFYQQRSRYDLRDYNASDYIVQSYGFVRLEYSDRIVQSVIIDSRSPDFMTVVANGNVIRAELDEFFAQLSQYRIVYKIENRQGVLVGFFAADPCVDVRLIAIRRPYNQFLSDIKLEIENFIVSGIWEFDLLTVEPCAPEELPCYFTLNDCYLTLNGCFGIVDTRKKFVKRFF